MTTLTSRERYDATAINHDWDVKYKGPGKVLYTKGPLELQLLYVTYQTNKLELRTRLTGALLLEDTGKTDDYGLPLKRAYGHTYSLTEWVNNVLEGK